MILRVTIQYEILTGLIGVVLIGACFWSCVRRNRGLTAAGGKRR